MGEGTSEDRGVRPKPGAPQLRDGLVPREVLVGRLRGSSAPIVAVEAAAGYGKTTLLRQWSLTDPGQCLADPRPVR